MSAALRTYSAATWNQIARSRSWISGTRFERISSVQSPTIPTPADSANQPTQTVQRCYGRNRSPEQQRTNRDSAGYACAAGPLVAESVAPCSERSYISRIA